jgi:hypothetical protein
MLKLQRTRTNSEELKGHSHNRLTNRSTGFLFRYTLQKPVNSTLIRNKNNVIKE